MGYLERIFLGTLILTGLLVMFMLALYFDFGDALLGHLRTHDFSAGKELEAIRASRKLAYDDEARARDQTTLRRAGGSRTGPSTPVNYERYFTPPVKVDPAVLVSREEERLRREGFTDPEFIAMKAAYVANQDLTKVFDEYDRLVDAGDYEAAIRLLEGYLEKVEQGNLLGRRDARQYLSQAYLLAGKKDEMVANLQALTDLNERILAIEHRAEQDPQPAREEYRMKMQESFSQMREALDKLADAPPLADQSFDAMGHFLRGEGPLELDPKALTAMRAEVTQRIGKGPPEGLTEEQARKLLDKFTVAPR